MAAQWLTFSVSIKTFTGWINNQLRGSGVAVEGDLFDAVHNGIVLIKLLEALTHKKMTTSWHEKPELDIHKLENITLALDFAKSVLGHLSINAMGMLFYAVRILACQRLQY